MGLKHTKTTGINSKGNKIDFVNHRTCFFRDKEDLLFLHKFLKNNFSEGTNIQ